MYAIVFLVISNIFMTFAWYGHLKWFKDWSMPSVILISWGIAFAEYCFQVPGNRMGKEIDGYSLPQLKILQEVITLVVFTIYSIVIAREPFRWNHGVGFGLLFVAAFFIFHKWN